MKLPDLRSKESQKLIVEAIERAELNTSGEIRVHIESSWKKDPVYRAVCIFNRLKMYKTAGRNGVLIYIAYKTHKFAIIGDTEINAVVPKDFWNGIIDNMATHFAEGHYIEGICTAIEKVGENLKEFFPYLQNDVNEQTNEISFGN